MDTRSCASSRFCKFEPTEKKSFCYLTSPKIFCIVGMRSKQYGSDWPDRANRVWPTRSSMSKHKFALPQKRFLVRDGLLICFVTREEADRCVASGGGMWRGRRGRVRCHNNGKELRLVGSDNRCDFCRAGGQCEPAFANVVEMMAANDPDRARLEAVLQSVSLEDRWRLDELIGSKVISNFVASVRILCAEPTAMPNGMIRAGVIVGPPPMPGDVRSLGWNRRLEPLDPNTMKFLEACRKQQADDKKRKAGDRKQRARDEKAGVILGADANVQPADADAILKHLTSYAELAGKKLELRLDEVFNQKPWATVPKARPHIEWFYKSYIENVLREAHAMLEPKDDYGPETAAAFASLPNKGPDRRVDIRPDKRVTIRLRRNPNQA